MTRSSSKKSYRHRVKQIAHDHWRVSWVVDFHYRDSRLRHPRIYSRDTDERGAKRFAKKWGLVIG